MRRCALLIFACLSVLVVGYGAACWYLWSQQRALIFLPTREVQRSPADLRVPFEDVWLPVDRDPRTALHGWWLPPAKTDEPTILYLHGNDLNIGASVEAVVRLWRMGFGVLIVDYRGYGKSGGAFPSEASVYEDAETAWTHLIRERRADPARVFLYGHSLGGAVAIELAVRHPEVGGVIVESAFTSMRDMAKIRYWMFPVEQLLHQRFDALAKVTALRVPLLLIHGMADAEVPYAMSEQLFAAAGAAKWLTLIPGGGHEDSAAVGSTLYARAVFDFTRGGQRAR